MNGGTDSAAGGVRSGAAGEPRPVALLRQSFVSLMSAGGVPVEAIARLVGHSSTTTTEAVYRKELRPVITEGAEVMAALFQQARPPSGSS